MDPLSIYESQVEVGAYSKEMIHQFWTHIRYSWEPDVQHIDCFFNYFSDAVVPALLSRILADFQTLNPFELFQPFPADHYGKGAWGGFHIHSPDVLLWMMDICSQGHTALYRALECPGCIFASLSSYCGSQGIIRVAFGDLEECARRYRRVSMVTDVMLENTFFPQVDELHRENKLYRIIQPSPDNCPTVSLANWTKIIQDTFPSIKVSL